MRARAFVAVVVVVGMVSLLACESSSPTTPTSTPPAPGKVMLQVTGRVIDYGTNRGVSGATLVWEYSGPHVPFTTTQLTTDATGAFTVAVPAVDSYSVRANAEGVGSVVVPLVPSLSYRTDFFVNVGQCVLWYGVVIDAITRQPVSGARVGWANTEVLSGADGSYRLDLGCRASYGSGTTLFFITHPDYASVSQFSTRAEFLVLGLNIRRDFGLTRRTASQ